MADDGDEDGDDEDGDDEDDEDDEDAAAAAAAAVDDDDDDDDDVEDCGRQRRILRARNISGVSGRQLQVAEESPEHAVQKGLMVLGYPAAATRAAESSAAWCGS